jgi:hypothetical protein
MVLLRSPQSRKEKEVWQVCDSLLESNTKITYQSVGDTLLKLGFCRGSNSDLCRYITTWKKRHKPIILAQNPISSWLEPSLNESWQKHTLDMLSLHQTQFDKLFNALQTSKKINAILQKKLYQITKRHQKLKRSLSLIPKHRR